MTSQNALYVGIPGIIPPHRLEVPTCSRSFLLLPFLMLGMLANPTHVPDCETLPTFRSDMLQVIGATFHTAYTVWKEFGAPTAPYPAYVGLRSMVGVGWKAAACD